MLTNSEVRKRARRVLEGNWGTAVFAAVVYYVIVLGLSSCVSIPFAYNLWISNGSSVLMTLLCMPLSWGFTVFFLSFVRNQEKSVGALFDGYKRVGRIWLAMFLKTLYVFLWTLLLVVPGIMKSMSYAMMEFILLDNPDMDAEDAIHRSRVMMDGHKMKLFLLYLSFIGWAILCLFTLGFGFLLLVPYIQTSLATFYQDLVDENARCADKGEGVNEAGQAMPDSL